MSTVTVLIIVAIVGVVGIAAGYFLRWIISLGQKGSVELQIKQKLLEAREEAKNIIAEGEKKAGTLEAGLREELRLKEESILGKEKRTGEKEAFLDKRQLDIDREADRIKAQIDEVRKIKERADNLIVEREKALETVAKLTEEEAKTELMKAIENDHEEDMMVRIQKLEIEGKERLESKARDIRFTA